jgi:hypothetical protein
MIDYVISFFALFFTDTFYTFYLKAVGQNKPIVAGSWAVVCYTIASLAIVNYVDNHWLIIPSCFGAFAGTYLGVFLRNKGL